MKYILAATLVCLFAFSSCETGDLEAEAPSYLAIDEVTVAEDASKGSNSQNITDVWVTMDNQFLGTYELPCRFPILDSGEHEFKIVPGIKLNGISGTRTQYFFYENCELLLDGEILEDNKVVLKTEETVYLSATTAYKELSKVPLNEDFESAGSFFQSIEKKDETIPLLSGEIRKTNDSYLVFEGSSSGIITLQADTNYIELESINSILIANKLGWSILEMDYKTDIPFTVGVFINNDLESVRLPSLTINPKDEWNKIYVHLTPQIGAPTQVSSYKIYLVAYKDDETEDATILLDNIKLIHQ